MSQEPQKVSTVGVKPSWTPPPPLGWCHLQTEAVAHLQAVYKGVTPREEQLLGRASWLQAATIDQPFGAAF